MTTRLELPEPDLASFAARFTGRVIRPDDADYPAARSVWNGMIDRYPALIVRPTNPDEVAAAIRLAREHDLPVAVRGGGHNVAGLGVCDTGVLIDLTDLAAVQVDPTARTIQAGGGCTWGALDAAAAAHGLATPGGLISTTGVGGLTLGGGIGWLARRYGYSSDNLLQVEVVTADGTTVIADQDRHPDLFWAIRGGGGNFGVVTSFTFAAHPVSTVLGGLVLYRGDRAGEVLAEYDRWAADLPDEMTTLAAVNTAPPAPFVPAELQFKPAVAVAVCHVGDPGEGAALVERFRRVCPPDADAVGPMPYPVLQSMLDASAPHGQRNYWKSGYLNTLELGLREAVIDAAARMVSPFDQIHLNQLGGAVRSHTGGAVGHRDAGYVVNVIGACTDPADDDANIAWARDSWAGIEPFTTGGYLNFLAGDDAGRVKSAYDPTTWTRLQQVKHDWDPGNVFHINHNIQPT
jgi:FAD/FMN-containing dehydrogenase